MELKLQVSDRLGVLGLISFGDVGRSVLAELFHDVQKHFDFFGGNLFDKLGRRLFCNGLHLVQKFAGLIGDGDDVCAAVVGVARSDNKPLSLKGVKVTGDGGLLFFRLFGQFALGERACLVKLVKKVPLAGGYPVLLK